MWPIIFSFYTSCVLPQASMMRIRCKAEKKAMRWHLAFATVAAIAFVSYAIEVF